MPDTATVERTKDGVVVHYENLLREALLLKEGSLVIYRFLTLVEFKTGLPEMKLSRFEEDGYVSWQVGAFEKHHLHVDLRKITGVQFKAEETTCQGGKLNYTIWFLVSDDIGNKYFPNGYFSVTLNKPYDENGNPRMDIVGQVFSLWEKYKDFSGISGDEMFLNSYRVLR